MKLTGTDAVGLDLDGTLLDHHAAAIAGSRVLFREAGVTASEAMRALWFRAERDHYARYLAGELDLHGQRRARVRDLLAGAGSGQSLSDQDADALFGVYQREYRAHWRLYPDVVQTLERVRRDGHRIGILTNGDATLQREKLEATGALALVDVVCASSDLGVAKPDPEAFRSLARALGTEPARMVFVGDDKAVDVDGARRAGIRASQVRTVGRTTAELGSAIRRAAVSRV